MDAFTPAQTTELIARIGAKKSKMRLDKLFFNSVIAGPLLGFGCALALSTETATWFQTNAPGLIRTIGATYFPVGLTMIILTGADLVTSNMMFMTVALIQRRCTIWELLVNWTVSFFGNLAGMLFFAIVITGYGGTFDAPVYRNFALTFATGKVITPQWHQIFLRGIGCNWLVCMAVFLGISSREIISKIFAIYLPIMTFVALGFDHVVANMYFMPLAIWLGHPEITVGLYIWKSIIPSLLGNIVGAVIFVSVPYWYFYLTGTEGVKIHFDMGGIDGAVQEMSGPGIDWTRRNTAASIDLKEGQVSAVDQLPDSSGHARSGLAAELSEEKFGRKASRTTIGTESPA